MVSTPSNKSLNKAMLIFKLGGILMDRVSGMELVGVGAEGCFFFFNGLRRTAVVTI